MIGTLTKIRAIVLAPYVCSLLVLSSSVLSQETTSSPRALNAVLSRQVSIENTAKTDAINAVVSFQGPDGTSMQLRRWDSKSASGIDCTSENRESKITCKIGMLPAGESIAFSFETSGPLQIFTQKYITSNTAVPPTSIQANGHHTNTITVEEMAPDINTAMTVGQTINERIVQDIPLNGRHFVDLALLVPGTATPPQNDFLTRPLRSQGSSAFNTAGSRVKDVTFKIDNSTCSAEHGKSLAQLANLLDLERPIRNAQPVPPDEPVAFWDVGATGYSEINLTENGNVDGYIGPTCQGNTMPNRHQADISSWSQQYLSIQSKSSFLVPTTKNLTWEGWIQPITLQFPHRESSVYDALWASANQQALKRFQFNSTYTYSKSIDATSAKSVSDYNAAWNWLTDFHEVSGSAEALRDNLGHGFGKVIDESRVDVCAIAAGTSPITARILNDGGAKLAVSEVTVELKAWLSVASTEQTLDSDLTLYLPSSPTCAHQVVVRVLGETGWKFKYIDQLGLHFSYKKRLPAASRRLFSSQEISYPLLPLPVRLVNKSFIELRAPRALIQVTSPPYQDQKPITHDSVQVHIPLDEAFSSNESPHLTVEFLGEAGVLSETQPGKFLLTQTISGVGVLIAAMFVVARKKLLMKVLNSKPLGIFIHRKHDELSSTIQFFSGFTISNTRKRRS